MSEPAFFIRELPHYDGANTTYGSLFIEVDDGTDESKHLLLSEAVEAIAAKRGAITASNLTVSTGNRMLGRQTGSGGAVQELILGSAFSFSSGTVIVDHGGLQGLGDDDHEQYHNDARGDLRYPQKTGANISGTWNLADSCIFAVGVTTGFMLGSASAQKLGFWGTTPAVQPAAVPDVTGGATIDAECRTTLNDLLAKLRGVGIIDT